VFSHKSSGVAVTSIRFPIDAVGYFLFTSAYRMTLRASLINWKSGSFHWC